MFLQSKRHERSILGLGLISLIVLLSIILLLSSPTDASSDSQENEPPVLQLPAEAIQAPQSLANSRAALASNPKMDNVLADAAEKAMISIDSAVDFAAQSGLRLEQEMVQVNVVAAEGSLNQAHQAVEESGGSVTFSSDIVPELQAWIPVSELGQVAEDTAVAYLRLPSYAIEQDIEGLDAQSEGLVALNGQAWQSAGYWGTGVKVAIIDGSFAGYPALLGSDLPANIIFKNFVDGENDSNLGSSKHGTACAEITADFVPYAQFFLLKISTNLDLEQAVNYAISQGVDVISTSLGWYNLTPGDGSGYFANLVNHARSNGITWVTASGNDRESHWGGAFYDPDNDGFHNFSGNQEINFFGPGIPQTVYLINPGYALRVFVRWDDWVSVNQDYILYVVRYNGSSWDLIASSDRLQSGFPGQTPTEAVYTVTSGTPAAYGFLIGRKNSNRAVNLEIFAPKLTRLDKIVMDRSLANLADAANALTVGAVDVDNPFPLEGYSSQGPTNGPGGTQFGGYIKPDFVGYAGVSTVSYGFKDFAGTSAAAPHAAGAAALVLDAYPNYSPQDIANYLAARAVDMGGIGKDNVYGYGRLYLGNPPDPTAGLNNHNSLPVILK